MTNPEVRQDQREDSPTFGAVAVKLPEGSLLGEWGYMSLHSGGGALPAQLVADWTVLTAAPPPKRAPRKSATTKKAKR